jgi:hypothetical protein
MAGSSDTQQVRLTAQFAEIDGQIRASIVVRFPFASLIRNQHATSVHPDRVTAEAWVRAEAKRRGIEWEPDRQDGTAPAPPR